MKIEVNQKAEKFIQKLQTDAQERKILKENWAEIFRSTSRSHSFLFSLIN